MASVQNREILHQEDYQDGSLVDRSFLPNSIVGLVASRLVFLSSTNFNSFTIRFIWLGHDQDIYNVPLAFGGCRYPALELAEQLDCSTLLGYLQVIWLRRSSGHPDLRSETFDEAVEVVEIWWVILRYSGLVCWRNVG